MAVILLDNVGSVVVGVERVHEKERDVDFVRLIEELDLTDGEIEEGHSITNFNDRLGADATHGSTKTTIELENGKLAEELNCIGIGEILILNDLALGGRVDAIPVHGISLGLIIQVAPEKREEIVHFSLEKLLLVGVLHRLSKACEGISHLGSRNVGRGILKSHVASSLAVFPLKLVIGILSAITAQRRGLEMGREGRLYTRRHCKMIESYK